MSVQLQPANTTATSGRTFIWALKILIQLGGHPVARNAADPLVSKEYLLRYVGASCTAFFHLGFRLGNPGIAIARRLFTCGAKRQARLREQILLGLGLLLPDNCPVGRYDHIIR